MGENTKIEWADHTFNPWTGCQKVSPGCDHCYAEGWSKRSGLVEWGPHGSRRRTSPANWRKPLKWDAEAKAAGVRRRVFCASLADVFDNHGSITSGWRGDLWHMIARTPNLDWLLLTKRPQNIAKMLPDGYGAPAWGNGWPNVWLGTTVENQAEADRRIPHLLSVPAKVLFLSCEPLLDEVVIDPCKLMGIDWIICGGESGYGARPMHPDWARSLRDQCLVAGVPFFFKQWGEWAPVEIEEDEEGALGAAYATPGCSDPSAHRNDQESVFWQGEHLVHWPMIVTKSAIGARRVGKARAGRLLDGREWNEVPE